MESGLRMTFLGTGTSVGVPVLTCDCPVCSSDDPRNERLRASVLLQWEDPGGRSRNVLVDTATDLRQQALRLGLPRVDAVLYTHSHADHLLGLDELRIYNFTQRESIPLYGNAATLDGIRRMFHYAFDESARGVPRLELHELDGPFELFGRRIEPVPVEHGGMEVLAYRIGGLAYVTDVSGIPERSAARLRGMDVLVIDALRRETHPAHFNLEEALREVRRLRPGVAYLTHLSHEFDHAALQEEVPDGVAVAYDGLSLEIGAGPGPEEPAGEEPSAAASGEDSHG